jgi:hypothetical protein
MEGDCKTKTIGGKGVNALAKTNKQQPCGGSIPPI